MAARRQLSSRDAMQELQEARLAYSARKYSDAVEHYRKALSALPKAPATEKQRVFICDSLSDALIAKAIDYRSVGRTDEAVEFLKEAVELSPSNQRAQLELTYTQDPVRTNPALSPQHVGDVAEVTRLLELAYGYLDLGKYDEAIRTFHEVRKYDSYNAAAMRGIEQARKRRSTYYAAAHDSYRSKMLADVGKQWEEMPEQNEQPGKLAEAVTVDSLQTLDSDKQRAVAEGLGKMVMPQIIFEEATIGEIIETLQNQILRFESKETSQARHINISANFGAPGSPGYNEIMEKRVNLNLSEVSVRDVLDLLSSQLGITYYYTPIGVELSYSGKDFGPMIDRSFTVPPHFFDAGADEEEEEEDDEESAFIDTSSKVAVRRVNPVQAFKNMGISFPEGASARYLPSSRTLHVRNTAYNMAEIEDALNAPVGELRQILLNVLVLQVNEKDLEDLGFDWLVKFSLDRKLFGGGGVAQAASTLTGLPSIPSVIREEGDYVTSGLRSGQQAFGQDNMEKLIETGSADVFGKQLDQPSPGIFSFRGVWSTADVAVIMRGLSQKKGVDILQNPQIIFTPAEEEQVVFANVREMFYPENYEAPNILSVQTLKEERPDIGLDGQINDSYVNSTYELGTAVAAVGAFPTDFVRYGMNEDEVGGIGTILQVHSAEVKEDGQYIDLALTTRVNDFEGFVNWGSPISAAITRGSSSGTVLSSPNSIEKITLTSNYILKPIFKRNMVNTSITVVPGTVLVFAGLQEAKTVRYQDKVPVLGDLPLVGRFFRSEGEENTRKVLLYMAKVDLIDPAGHDVRTGKRPEGMMK